MIDPTAKLSMGCQAIMLGISWGSVQYTLRPVSDAGLKLMHRVDKTAHGVSLAGSWILRGLLDQDGFKVGWLHVATLMKRMGIEALYRKPNTQKASGLAVLGTFGLLLAPATVAPSTPLARS